MKTQVTLCVLLAVVSFGMSACGPGQPLGPTLTPVPTPTPVPAVGIPVIGERWEITVDNVQRKTSLQGNAYNTVTPNSEDDLFLVVNVSFHYLASDAENWISMAKISLVDAGGQSISPIGTNGGGGDSYFFQPLDIKSEDQASASCSLVFLVSKDSQNQDFGFQFEDLPAIPLK